MQAYLLLALVQHLMQKQHCTRVGSSSSSSSSRSQQQPCCSSMGPDRQACSLVVVRVGGGHLPVPVV
jgi:hypothetical protein